MPNPFFTALLPSVTEGINVGPSYARGLMQAASVPRQLALLDAEIKQKQAMAKSWDARTQHGYGGRINPKLEELLYFQQVNPEGYTEFIGDPYRLMQFFGAQGELMNTPAGVLSRQTKEILPGTAKSVPPSTPYTKDMRTLSMNLFGKDPGLTGVTLSPQEQTKLMEQDEARRTRIQGGQTTAQLEAKEKSPTAAYTHDFIQAARAINLDPLNREKPLTPKEHQRVLEKMRAEKRGAKEPGERTAKVPKPMSTTEAQEFVSGLQAERSIDAVLAQLEPSPGEVDRTLLSNMLLRVPYTEGRELSNNAARALAIILKLRSGASVTESEAARLLPGYMPSMFDTDRAILDNLREFRQSFADTIALKDPTGYYREQLKKGRGIPTTDELPSSEQPPSSTSNPFAPGTRNELYSRIRQQHPDWSADRIFDLVKREFGD